MSNRHTWAAGMVAASLGLSGCGNYVNVEVIGASGFSHDGQGNIVVHVQTCGEPISQLDVTADREGLVADEPNEVLARYFAPEAQSGHIQVNLSDPAPWAEQLPLDAAYSDDRALLLNPAPDDTGGNGVFARGTTIASSSATKREIFQQPAGTVLSVSPYDGSMQTWTATEFDAAC